MYNVPFFMDHPALSSCNTKSGILTLYLFMKYSFNKGNINR